VTTGDDLILAATAFVGQPYSTEAGRDNPTSGHKDCSGLVAAAYKMATGSDLGATVSSTIFAMCARQGLEITRDEAFATAGTVLLMPENPAAGIGSAGHIGFSDGNGGTVEATPPRVQRLSTHFQSWGARACKLPGINYGEEDDDMPKGFLAKDKDQPFVWFIAPTGVRLATTNVEHQNLLHFFGHSANGPDNVFALPKQQLEAYPVWDPAKP
jgi:cell wall-associated NlpC family hydrolase